MRATCGNQVPDVAIRTLERDIRGLQLVLPGGRVPWIFEGGTWWNVVSVGAFNQTEIGSLDVKVWTKMHRHSR